MCTSVPHTPARRTRMSTSLSRIAGCGTSRSANPGPAVVFTNALTIVHSMLETRCDAWCAAVARRNLARTRERWKWRARARDVLPPRVGAARESATHDASPCAMRDSLLRAISHVPIFAQVDRYSCSLVRAARVGERGKNAEGTAWVFPAPGC